MLPPEMIDDEFVKGAIRYQFNGSGSFGQLFAIKDNCITMKKIKLFIKTSNLNYFCCFFLIGIGFTLQIVHLTYESVMVCV